MREKVNATVRSDIGCVFVTLDADGSSTSVALTIGTAYQLARHLVAEADRISGKGISDEVGFVRWYKGLPYDTFDDQLLSTVITSDGHRVTGVDEANEFPDVNDNWYIGLENSDPEHTVAWAFLPEPARWIDAPVRGVDFDVKEE